MADSYPYQKAVVFPVGRDSNDRVSYTHLTYRQLADDSDTLARGFIALGITKGTKVALMAKPSLDFFALTFAIFKIGAVPVLIDPGMGVKSIKQCLREAGPEVFIGIPKAHIARIILRWGSGKFKTLIWVGRKLTPGGISLNEVRLLGRENPQTELPPVSPNDTAAILFTSGSTGSPKGAVYTHKNFQAQVVALQTAYQIQPGEIDLCTFPLFALFSPALGMTAIIPDMDFTKPAQVDPNLIYEAVCNFGVTNLFGSPALLKRITTVVETNNSDISFPTIKRVISAGAPVPPETLEKFSKLLNPSAKIHAGYGATEALPVCSIDHTQVLSDTAASTFEGKGVCVGRPVPSISVSIIRISDDPIPSLDNSMELPVGEIGEITVRGPQVTETYINRPDSVAQGKMKDPATGEIIHRMGDLGYKDHLGRIWFCGRKAHRVKLESETLFTIPCESIFNHHKSVNRTALVSVKTKNGNNLPVLCVETDNTEPPHRQEEIKEELLVLGRRESITKPINTIVFHKSFPVDIRHNSKIFREKLSVWAAKEINGDKL